MNEQDFPKTQIVKAGFLNRSIHSLGNIIILICILLTPIFLFSTTSWALNNASLDGTYVLYDMQTAFGGTDSNGGWGANNSASISHIEVTFNGTGRWNGTSTDYGLERWISEVPIVGTMCGATSLTCRYHHHPASQ